MIQNKTIWINHQNELDTYAEFLGRFAAKSNKKVWLRIACDGHFAVYVNNELAYFGASADYPWYKLCHKKEITDFCRSENEIRTEVWYPGQDSQTYIKDDAGLYLVVEQDGDVLLESDENILCRRMTNYKNGYCKIITSQMGFSFYYDNTIENQEACQPSVERKPYEDLHMRKTGALTLGKRVKVKCKTLADGYLIDLGEEVVGFLDMDFVSKSEQEVMISYGEHLVDGRVPRIIGTRDFSVEFHAKQGENTYMNPFRRLAGRYLQVACKEPLEIGYIGIRPTDRRVIEKKRVFADKQLQKIYDVSVNTLKKCMHEHYEDCPWREQAMYALDSRNQMLCGYYAFKGSQYQRENLLFIAQGQRADGLLSLCFPAGIDIPIPFFSLAYLMQVDDYVKHTGDIGVLKKLKPVLDRILKTFLERRDESGLIPDFPYPYWNFYEWSEGSHNDHEIGRKKSDPYHKQYDLILNCMFVYACRLYQGLYGDYASLPNVENMAENIHKTFYNTKRGGYRLSTNGEHYSQLGNCFAILIGLGDKELAEKITRDESLIPVTLSMNTFYYDALLSVDEGFASFVIEDIREKYSRMLDEGATIFWETELGWKDFDGAGSLCHGWSAIPAYYLSVLA